MEVCENGDFRYVDWNRVVEEITGIPSEQAKDRSPEELFGAIYGKAVCKNYIQCVREGTYAFEEPFSTGENTSWWQTRLTLIRNNDGRPHQILGLAANITERKHAEEELHESRERYKSLYNNTPVMMHSIDPQGRLLSVSDYWLQSLGYTRDEVLGRSSTDFLTEDSRRYARETVLPQFLKDGQCKDVPYQFVKKKWGGH